jgi:hypothetical protein
MGEVLSFPNELDRSWNLMAPGYRETLQELGIGPGAIEAILGEMEGLYKRINGSVETIGVAIPADAGASVTDAVRVFAQQATEAGRTIADTAHGIVLQLLIEKHG